MNKNVFNRTLIYFKLNGLYIIWIIQMEIADIHLSHLGFTLRMIMDTAVLYTGTKSIESTGKSATEGSRQEQRMRW